jgi:orotate phosphoribosyltransferase
MSDEIFKTLPSREGHFLLESGYHTDVWFDLEALFLNPRQIAPLVTSLAGRLSRHDLTAICGPLLGGAFLAQAVATELDTRFYYTHPVAAAESVGLYQAEYQLPPELRRRVSGERVAIVDDIVSAGSSVRATEAALNSAGARTIVVGAFMALGNVTREYFSGRGIPVETLLQRDFKLWAPADCALCRKGIALISPT